MAKGKSSFFRKKEDSTSQAEPTSTDNIPSETKDLNTENMAETKEHTETNNNSTEEATTNINGEETVSSANTEETESKEQAYQKQVTEIQDKYIRLMAEFDNFRKRSLKERTDLIKSAGEDILVNILPVMDDFERGLTAMNTAEDIESVKQGVQLIYNKFKDFLVQRGVKEIDALKQDFDVDVHEAITKIPAPEEDLKGKVIDVVQKGYTLNDKVIRYAKVVVGE